MNYNKLKGFLLERLTLYPTPELALIWAVEMNLYPLVKAFAYSGIDIRYDNDYAIRSAVNKGNHRMIQLLKVLGSYSDDELHNMFLHHVNHDLVCNIKHVEDVKLRNDNRRMFNTFLPSCCCIC